MKFSIIAIGDEVLTDVIKNTTTPWISSSLMSHGFSPVIKAVVPDKESEIISALDAAWEKSDIIVLTGGLGPTPDDLTKKAVSSFLGIPMIFSKKIESEIRAFFKKLNREMPESNKNQAMIPEGASTLPNDFGTAPGIEIKKDSKRVILLPGPPRELKPMWNNHILPTLKTDSKIFHKDFYVLGLPESKMTDMLGSILDTENEISVAPYASLGEIRLRVSANSKDEDEFLEETKSVVTKIKGLLDGHIFKHPAPKTLTNLLSREGLKISTAESCTGGLIAKTLTDISGVSSVFMGGAVTYSNQAKMDILGISEETLKQHGAASPQVAEEMALGAKRIYKSDIAISTTGIAGPTGGTPEKPVGLVYTAIATPDDVTVFKNTFLGSRDDVRWRTLMKVLWECIKQFRNKGEGL